MGWIEQLLHMSPDGGNGLFELLLVVVVAALVLGLLILGPVRRRIRR